MIAELGHFALILALALALVQSAVPILPVIAPGQRWAETASIVSLLVFAAIVLAFLALTRAYVLSDFSLENVWLNSHSHQPLIYKITGVWGNHEGSMLLWVLILAFFSALVALLAINIPTDLKTNVLGVQGWIITAFLLFILLTSNPFNRLMSPPLEGKDLNPILQDIGLAVHPPLLYLGYVGFSVTFAFAVAAMLSGRIDAAWAGWVRPWALAAWMFLTGGIALGSYWAYYELGWGGWWFWDPVENASFIPWLTGTALLHCALVMEKRGALSIWTVLLAIITFSASLLGTFLVRSGVLTSVHSFANDPDRGVFILAILVLFIGGSLTLFAVRAPNLRAGGLFQPISREGALVLNNLFLASAAATVLIGTLYPLFIEALSNGKEKISVGAPYFNLTFGPLMVPLLLLVPFGPLLSWKRAELKPVLQRLYWVFAISIIVTLAMLIFSSPLINFAAFGISAGIGLAVWLLLGSLSELFLRAGLPRIGWAAGLRRLWRLPINVWSAALGHFGLGMTVLGIVVVTGFESELIAEMKPGDSKNLSGHQISYQNARPVQGPNYVETIARFEIVAPDGEVFFLEPSKRHYTARGMPTTEAAIKTNWFSQLYLSLGEISSDGALVLRAWSKPFITLIWLGALVMVAGGALSLFDRRVRVGVARPSSSQAGAEPAPGG